jgi:hypothetical protein
MSLPPPILPSQPPKFDYSAALRAKDAIQTTRVRFIHLVETRIALGARAVEKWEGEFRKQFDAEQSHGLRLVAIANEGLIVLDTQISDAIEHARYRDLAYAFAMDQYNVQQQAYIESVHAERIGAR